MVQWYYIELERAAELHEELLLEIGRAISEVARETHENKEKWVNRDLKIVKENLNFLSYLPSALFRRICLAEITPNNKRQAKKKAEGRFRKIQDRFPQQTFKLETHYEY